MRAKNPPIALKRGYRTGEAATYIGRSSSWLRKKRLRGIDDPADPGPRYITMAGGSALYLREDLDQWLDDHLATSGPTRGARTPAPDSESGVSDAGRGRIARHEQDKAIGPKPRVIQQPRTLPDAANG